MINAGSSNRDTSNIKNASEKVRKAEKTKFDQRHEAEQNRPGIGMTRQAAERARKEQKRTVTQNTFQELAKKSDSDGRMTKQELQERREIGGKSTIEIALGELIEAQEDMRLQEERMQKCIQEGVKAIVKASAQGRKSTS